MIIIKDTNEENRQDMRSYMRSRMRSGRSYRTSTTHYKDDDSWKDGYEKGWKDCEEEMGA